MAFKDLEVYYDRTKHAYFSALNLCQEYDKEHKEGIVEDKDFRKFKKEISLLKDRYENLSYFFLYWSKPSDEEQKACKDWKKEHKEELNYLKKRDADTILKNNSKIVEDIEKFIKEKSNE